MRSYINFQLKNNFGSKRILGLNLLILIALVSLFWWIHQGKMGDHFGETYEELNQTRLATMSSQTYYIEETDETNSLSKNIFAQQGHIAHEYNGYTFENPEWVYESGMALAKLRLNFPKEDLAEESMSQLFPSDDHSRSQYVLNQALLEGEYPLRFDGKNLYDYTRYSLILLSLLSLLILAIGFYDIGLDFNQHESVYRALPLTERQKEVATLTIRVIFIFISVLLTWLLSLLLPAIIWDDSFISHPYSIYLLGKFVTIPIYFLPVIFFAYLAILSIFIGLLSHLLNARFKNAYFTLVVLLVIYGLSVLNGELNWSRVLYLFQPVQILEHISVQTSLDLLAYLLLLSFLIVLVIFLKRHFSGNRERSAQ